LKAVKHKNGLFGKKCAILQKICAVLLVYGGIVGMHNRHRHTKILNGDTKEKSCELLKKWPTSHKKWVGSDKNLGPIMTVSPLAKIGVT